MSSYIRRHAELYDLFYAAKPYSDEAAFVHRCLQEHSVAIPQRILELACGTGAHAFALEKFGYTIVATDYSKDMLAVARRKADQTSSTVDFRFQDMRALDLPERSFDAVICLFDAIGYVNTNDALRQVFQGVHCHLRSQGLFVFEFWHASAMLKYYEPVRVRHWKTAQGQVLRISETELNVAEQLAKVTYTVYELADSGTYSGFKEAQVNRYFLVQELQAWLESNGFSSLKWFAGYRQDEKIDDSTWHIVAVARRLE